MTALVVAVNLMACGRSDEPTQTAQTTKTKEIIHDPGSSKEEDQKLKADRKKGSEERRKQIVEEIRRAFDLAA